MAQRVGNEVYGAPIGPGKTGRPIQKITVGSNSWVQVAPGLGSAFGDVNIGGLWANGPADIYLVGHRLDIYHYNGQAWSRVRPPSMTGCDRCVLPIEVWGSAGGDVFVALGPLLRGRGTSWVEERFAPDAATQQQARAVWGSGEDVFVGTNNNRIYHRRAGQWRLEYAGPTSYPFQLRRLTGTGPNDIWAYNFRELLHSVGDGTWRVVTVPQKLFLSWNIWASAPGELLIPNYIEPGIDRYTSDGAFHQEWAGGNCGDTGPGIVGFSETEVLALHCRFTAGNVGGMLRGSR